jgi:hypothetical protein
VGMPTKGVLDGIGVAVGTGVAVDGGVRVAVAVGTAGLVVGVVAGFTVEVGVPLPRAGGVGVPGVWTTVGDVMGWGKVGVKVGSGACNGGNSPAQEAIAGPAYPLAICFTSTRMMP